MRQAKKTGAKTVSLTSLPLFGWFLSELGFRDWDAVRKLLSDSAFEERAPDGSSQYCNVLTARASAHRISAATLSRYDAAILRDWDTVVRRRAAAWGAPRLKYFQYLCLLAVEHLLTRFVDDAGGLTSELNAFDQGAEYTIGDLTKMAVSLATGSGKTLSDASRILDNGLGLSAGLPWTPSS